MCSSRHYLIFISQLVNFYLLLIMEFKKEKGKMHVYKNKYLFDYLLYILHISFIIFIIFLYYKYIFFVI